MSVNNLPKGRLSGSYIPELTIVANLDTVSVDGQAHWCVVGDLVIVFFGLNWNQTAAGNAAIRMSLPPEVNKQLESDELWGIMSAGEAGIGGQIVANDFWDQPLCTVDSQSLNVVPASGCFAYRLEKLT